jgi:hypothetical protein
MRHCRLAINRTDKAEFKFAGMAFYVITTLIFETQHSTFWANSPLGCSKAFGYILYHFWAGLILRLSNSLPSHFLHDTSGSIFCTWVDCRRDTYIPISGLYLSSYPQPSSCYNLHKDKNSFPHLGYSLRVNYIDRYPKIL